MNESVANSRNNGYVGPPWPTVMGTVLTCICSVIAAVAAAIITANSNWLGVSATNASTDRQAKVTISENRQREVRGERRDAYLEYLSNLDSYFNTMFALYGCQYWEMERSATHVSMTVPAICETPLRAFQPTGIDIKFSAYWNARAKLHIYGTEWAHHEMELIELELPTLHQEGTTVWVVSGGLDYEKYQIHYSRLQGIARCDLLAGGDTEQC